MADFDNIVFEGDTTLGHYQIIDTIYDGRPARVLYSGNRQAAQAGIAKDDKPELLFDYNQRMFELGTSLVPKRILLIGAAVCTLPMALLAALPDIRIDAIETDEGLIDLAYRFFDLPVDERLRIFRTDGRTYLREHADKYDMILVDAFTHTTIPRDLITVQAMQALHKHLNKTGLVAMNVISAYNGNGASTLREIYAGYCQVFDAVDIFLASRGYSLWLPQNFVFTAQKGENLPLKDYMRCEAVSPPEVNPSEALQD